MVDFLVVDTEGKDELREIAIVNRYGKVIYEAFSQEHPDNFEAKINTKPLAEILLDLFRLADSKFVVFHFAEHDLQVLRNSCQKAQVDWQNLEVKCSYELAKRYFPNLPSYSLEYLSKYLGLKVDNRYFNPVQAHAARYDAEFTYQLFNKIQAVRVKTILQDKPNPFGSSRVDTPFQDHPDLKEIYQSEFELLRSIIIDIKHDRNRQSRGAVVIGEPGSGKTHLMMRLAKELLQINRLLFIRQPNNPDSILYHIYSRVLESFVQIVPGNGYTQLENLLAHSFVKLISTTSHITLTQKDQAILAALNPNPLNLYESLGAEDTQKKREYWQHIERRTNEWWMNQYGLTGFSAQIIKGIVKFCSYRDLRRKELVARWLAAAELEPEELEKVGLPPWNEELSKEEFSLEAISVFSKLSLLDEPLIIVFDQLEGLGLKHNERLLISFGEAVKEIFTHVPNSLIILNLFPDRWQQFQYFFDGSIVDRVSQYEIQLQRPSNHKLREILQLKAQSIGLNLDMLFSPIELETILNQASIRAVLNWAASYYRYKVSGAPLPKPVEKSEIVSPSTMPSPHLGEFELTHRIERLEQGYSQLQQVLKEIQQTLKQICAEDLGETPVSQLSQATASACLDSVPPLTEETASEVPPETCIETPSATHCVLEYLERQQHIIEEEYSQLQIITDSDDLGKLLTILEAIKSLRALEIHYLRLGRKRLPEHLVLKYQNQRFFLGFLQVDGGAFTSRLKNLNELVLNHKDIQFQLWRDSRQPEIRGKVGREAIARLNHTPNGCFSIMNQENRVRFELLYQLIIDIQNRDLEVDLEVALPIVMTQLKDYWLMQKLQ